MNRFLCFAFVVATFILFLGPSPAAALPKGLDWGMSPSEAQKILGDPVKLIKTGKVLDAYFNSIDYAGVQFDFHLAFNQASGLFYMDASASNRKGFDCTQVSACRENFEIILKQLDRDIPGIGTNYDEDNNPSLKAYKIIFKTTGRVERNRFVCSLSITPKMIGRYGFILQQMKK